MGSPPTLNLAMGAVHCKEFSTCSRLYSASWGIMRLKLSPIRQIGVDFRLVLVHAGGCRIAFSRRVIVADREGGRNRGIVVKGRCPNGQRCLGR